jgi:predicted dienelactone hydrolase
MSASAGCRSFSLFDVSSGRSVAVLVVYPSDAPERPAQVGSYTLDVARDGPIAGGVFPLVVVSHGNGGSGVLYRSTALHLARNGFVVALPDHAGNTRGDNDLAGTVANLENRPRDVRFVIDWSFGASPFAPHLAAGSVTIIGHSLGGYTALAVAGGQPDGVARQSADERVRALVLLAPATAWFRPAGSLHDVHVPILMLTAEHDAHTPPFHADVVKRGLPDPALLEHHVVPNGGHFSFLGPFPAAVTNASFPPSQDAPGFDRERFHVAMNAQILAFLLQNDPLAVRTVDAPVDPDR